MSKLYDPTEGKKTLFMGNDAIARGALEAGVNVAAAYPGTPSSEILEGLAKVPKEAQFYVEWSVNEKVAAEVAAAGSFAGLRSMMVMKQNGLNVASDFILHLAGCGVRAGLVMVVADDPGALSSTNEGETRHFARMLEIPLLEPGNFQEAKDMTKWAFELSEQLNVLVMVRSVTRMSHASGNVILGPLPKTDPKPKFVFDGFILDQMTGKVITTPVNYRHQLAQKRVQAAAEQFESSPFNTYEGPEKPELLVITSSAATLYADEAIAMLGLADRVGRLKLGTTWPLPEKLVARHLAATDRVLFVEEVINFLEDHVKVLAAEKAAEIGIKTFHGNTDGTIPSTGELNPDIVMAGLSQIFELPPRTDNAAYEERAKALAKAGAPMRDLTFCPGCPHRASFFAIHNAIELDNRNGFVCGDIGCYSMAALPAGFSTLQTIHAMGSGAGIASGFGKLKDKGFDQPVLAVCGDSTFFHAVLPALANAVHNESDITLVILDNSGTAMTGFQTHPGRPVDITGNAVPALNLEMICRAMGATVRIADPFDLAATQETLLDLMENVPGAKVLILRQICALSPERKGKKLFEMSVDKDICRGEDCGCNRLCTRVFSCPGLVVDDEKGHARIDEVQCAGCGVCADICPSGAISKKEVA